MYLSPGFWLCGGSVPCYNGECHRHIDYIDGVTTTYYTCKCYAGYAGKECNTTGTLNISSIYNVMDTSTNFNELLLTNISRTERKVNLEHKYIRQLYHMKGFPFHQFNQHIFFTFIVFREQYFYDIICLIWYVIRHKES